jgi:hypothetical protein
MRRLIAAGVLCSILASGIAFAAGSPGTAAQVKALVAASTKINKLTPALSAELANASSLSTRSVYPSVGSACLTACAFGNLASSKTIVIFGDSHALMWLPTVITAEPAYKIDLFWDQTCALAAIPGLYFKDGVQNANCAPFRSGAIAAIKTIDPKLVILGERTYQAYTTGGVPVSDATWAKALEATILKIKSKTTHVALMQDVIAFDLHPIDCLAAYPSNIQKHCTVLNPNPKTPAHQPAEKTAATVTGIKLVITIPWFCTTRCSPVVGTYIVHSDQGHISVPYAKYLAGVLATAIAPLLK